MKINTLVFNGLLAAIYIAVTLLIQPFGFTNVQFRVPEMLNHLVAFNKKFIFGIVLGVLLADLFFSPLGLYELGFGVPQSIISLLITILAGKYIKNKWVLLSVNTLIFTFTMFIIAWELNLAIGLPFLFTWLTTAIGEFVVMAVGIPIMIKINKYIKFDKLI